MHNAMYAPNEIALRVENTNFVVHAGKHHPKFRRKTREVGRVPRAIDGHPDTDEYGRICIWRRRPRSVRPGR